MDILETVVGTKSRAEILRLLFGKPNTELYLRELHRRSKLSIRPIQTELARLLKSELIKARKDGNRLYYSANKAHPVFPEIRSLVEKTSGIRELLKAALTDPGIQIVFIFGSIAAGKARAESDLDLFVLGNVGLRKVVSMLHGMTDRVGREVNPHTMSVQEFQQKLHARNHFITTIMGAPKTFIIGDENELKRLGKERLARSS